MGKLEKNHVLKESRAKSLESRKIVITAKPIKYLSRKAGAWFLALFSPLNIP